MEQIDRESYAVLRQGGASQARACAELSVNSGRGLMLEAVFRATRPGKGETGGRPRFARNARHVESVLAAGGYPVLAR
jgi:hypothetical protein